MNFASASLVLRWCAPLVLAGLLCDHPRMLHTAPAFPLSAFLLCTRWHPGSPLSSKSSHCLAKYVLVAVQVQNALNKRVALQCTLLLTSLDLPLPLNEAELRAQDDVRRCEQAAQYARADAKQIVHQVQHLLEAGHVGALGEKAHVHASDRARPGKSAPSPEQGRTDAAFERQKAADQIDKTIRLLREVEDRLAEVVN